MSRRWLVTGGAGFIGSHLVERLLRQGDRAVVLDNFTSGSAENLPGVAAGDDLRVLKGDVTCPEHLAAAMSGVSGVFHCAATVGVQDCIDDWLGAHGTNATATLRVFDAARRAGGLPVVYASSAAVYGDRSGESCHEDLPERPVSPYGADKLACEHHARAFWHVHRLPTVGVRLFNVYGPRQTAASSYAGVLALFSRNLQVGVPNTVFGDGRQSRDFIHVDDVAAGMIAAMSRLDESAQCFVSNLCTGRSVSILQLLSIIEGVAGAPSVPIEFRPPRAGDIRHSRGCTARMTEFLQHRISVSLEEGIRSYLTWLGFERADDAAIIQAAE